MVNYFSLMLQQRMRSGDEDGDLEDPEEGKTKKSSSGNKKGACHAVATNHGPVRPFITFKVQSCMRSVCTDAHFWFCQGQNFSNVKNIFSLSTLLPPSLFGALVGQ